MEYYLLALKKYMVFKGRARRKEYWMFILINVLINIVLGIIDNSLGTAYLGLIYSLVVLLPGIAVTVRRLHDIDKSGWWILISLIPVLGGIILLYFMILDGKAEDNQYGSSPKYW